MRAGEVFSLLSQTIPLALYTLIFYPLVELRRGQLSSVFLECLEAWLLSYLSRLCTQHH